MITIKKINAWQIFDSNGFPTLAGNLELSNRVIVSASIPSTFSNGQKGALELRDNNNQLFDGYSVNKSVYYINNLISPKLFNVDPRKQKEIDYWLINADKTENKSILGGNTTLLVSVLIAKAGAVVNQLPLYQYLNQLYTTINKTKVEMMNLPRPVFNLFDGGKHARTVEFQEYYVYFPPNASYLQFFQQFFVIRERVKEELINRDIDISVGTVGGFAPNFKSNVDVFEILVQVINQLSLANSVDVFLGVDFLADNFFKNEGYQLRDFPDNLSKEKYYQYLLKILADYKIIFVEDPFSEFDKDSWKKLYQKMSDQLYIVADKILFANKNIFKKYVKDIFFNSVLVKPSYLGTITETMELIDIIKKNKLTLVVGSNSGEVNDDFIADFSVAVQADFVKFGALNRGERVSKYNRLLKIEDEVVKSR